MGSLEWRWIAGTWTAGAVAYLVTRTLKLRGYIGST
jgi:hypothetical protein